VGAALPFVLFVSRYDGFMSATLTERTVLPPDHPAALAQLLAVLSKPGGQRATLTAPDGTILELPPDAYGVLRDVVQAMSQGLAITVAPLHTTLSTSEAAALLGVSRPTLVRFLEAGQLPYSQPGRHRRLRLADVLAFRESSRRARATSLDEMVRVSEKAGLYADADDGSFHRQPTDSVEH
jgi:excisionase family DNA binding protein